MDDTRCVPALGSTVCVNTDPAHRHALHHPPEQHLVNVCGNRLRCSTACPSEDPHLNEYRAPDVKGG